MTGVKGQSGVEPNRWAKVYRRANGSVLTVQIPVSLMREAGMDPDVPILVRRRTGKDRGAVFLQFRPASEVPEQERGA
jgi:hypothetical protein